MWQGFKWVSEHSGSCLLLFKVSSGWVYWIYTFLCMFISQWFLAHWCNAEEPMQSWIFCHHYHYWLWPVLLHTCQVQESSFFTCSGIILQLYIHESSFLHVLGISALKLFFKYTIFDHFKQLEVSKITFNCQNSIKIRLFFIQPPPSGCVLQFEVRSVKSSK